ncbi:hypothetical protein VOLCADRAFT_121659, partial [Volvox carteri f. nagariensis]
MPEASIRRTDAKAFFANERTFLHWMSTSVTIGGIAAALSGVAGHAHRHWGDEFTERAIVVRVVSLVMLFISVAIAVWAGLNFQKRAIFLEAKADGPYDSRFLPVLLTVCMRYSNTKDSSQELFFRRLERDVEKVNRFTNKLVEEMRASLRNLNSKAEKETAPDKKDELMQASQSSAGPSIPQPGSVTRYLRVSQYGNTKYDKTHQTPTRVATHPHAYTRNAVRTRRTSCCNTLPCRPVFSQHPEYLFMSIRYLRLFSGVGVWRQEAQRIGDDFLALEKFVNINYLPWVQGNYSDLLVSLSNIYSKLRGDSSGEKNEYASQGFVRSTTKYWVRNEDVSTVKHHVLQHLPVFQFDKNNFTGDAQLINSVYMDNSNLELYHGRLDKKPGAIALRIRWYGSHPPTLVFFERKTHKESWKGEESVKERFTLPSDKVWCGVGWGGVWGVGCRVGWGGVWGGGVWKSAGRPGRVVAFMDGEYSLEHALADQEAAAARKGKSLSEEEKESYKTLFMEVYKAVDSKQLKPLVRTQYMRTAFQIPFDATVRISLDTNLCMIKENPEDGPSCAATGRWYRDPSLPVMRTEITRFPHAVLEVKLSLQEGQQAPAWVQ